ncbi:MAG: hypothetical protein KGI38_10940 [Thaumarchaeota archaeon]|nr:hypothetical protein [Nitrososphaerota archaeon]
MAQEAQVTPKPSLTSVDGVIMGGLSGERVLVLPARFWNEVKAFLVKAYGSSVHEVLSRFAEEFGGTYASRMKASGMKPAQVLEAMGQMALTAGWGTVDFGGDMEGGKSLVIDVTDCAFCTVDEDVGTKTCDFLKGVAVGTAAAIYDKQFSCYHIEKEQGGVRVCRLTLSQTQQPKKANWKTAVYFPWMSDTK